MLKVRGVARWTAMFVMGMALGARAQTQLPEDKYLWLEDASGTQAMDWVKTENAKTTAVFEADPQFAADYANALAVLNDPEKLAVPGLYGNWVYNQWRDAQHLRGLFRRTTLADYLTENPKWETVLDTTDPEREGDTVDSGAVLPVTGRSVIVLRRLDEPAS